MGPALRDPILRTRQNKKTPMQKTRTRLRGREPTPKSLLIPTPTHEQMVHCCSWSHQYRSLSSDDRIKGIKTISKRVVTKDTATGHKKIKMLWILDIDIEYDDLDNEYDTYYEAQQTWKRQVRKQHRVAKVLALAKGEEPEETDSKTSWMGYSDGDDDMDEVNGKQVDVGAGGQVRKKETNLVDEMVYDLGMKCWRRRTVEGKKINMPVVGTDHSLVETVELAEF